MNTALKSLATFIFVIVTFFLWYFILPPVSLLFVMGFLFISLTIVVVATIILIWVSDKEFLTMKTPNLLGIAVISIVITGMICSLPCFHAMSRRNQIGTVEEVEYSEMIEQIDTSQIPIVDLQLAKKQADKKIGQDVALGSRVELGDGAIQNVNGEIMYVFPLEHTGVLKWSKHRSTPGYITVSASNPNKVEYVTELDGSTINIFYSPSSCFSYDLKRYIWSNGYNSMELTENTFELDNNGRPYWVVTAYKNTTLWSGPETQGVIIVDAQNGDINYYTVSEVPEWVDIVQPSNFVESQIDNWGKYVHGFWNLSNTDKIQKTDLLLTVYVDGDCYYFTGMTSVGSDNSCVGFIMVNTRNKNAKIAYMPGANESAAMSSAEGLVSNFGYKSTEPLPLNVNGIPTYVMALKDNEGLIKNYAMVNIDNYSIAAKGSTLLETSKNYMQAVTRNSTTYVVSSDEVYGYELEGTVKRIASEVQDGSTQYFLVLKEKPEMIFTASYSVSEEFSVTQVGDKVKIYYFDSSNGTIDIISFDNLGFNIQKSEEQEIRDKMDEGVSPLDSKYNEIHNVNPELNKEVWDGLSEEEKTKLVEQFLNK